jgi:hypothetical protein
MEEKNKTTAMIGIDNNINIKEYYTLNSEDIVDSDTTMDQEDRENSLDD